jgi:hypothetical protein
MIFVAFTFLSSKPVHKKAIVQMTGEDYPNKQNDDCNWPKPWSEANYQENGSKKLDKYDQESDQPGQMQGSGKEIHFGAKARTAKPAEYLLGTMRK